MDYRRRAWVPGAACRGLTDTDPRQVCINCPVLEQCRVTALVNEKYEIYGGMTAAERTKWRRENYQELKSYALTAIEQGWFDPYYNCLPGRMLTEIKEDKFFEERLRKKAEADSLYESQPRPLTRDLTTLLAYFREVFSSGLLSA